MDDVKNVYSMNYKTQTQKRRWVIEDNNGKKWEELEKRKKQEEIERLKKKEQFKVNKQNLIKVHEIFEQIGEALKAQNTELIMKYC